MSGSDRIKRVFRMPGSRRGPQGEVSEELRFHIQERIERLLEAGWSLDEARREAERRFGDLERISSECVGIDKRKERRMRTKEWIGTLGMDLKLAFRGLRKRPGFGAALVLTLGLGFGANTAVYTVVDSVLFRPIAFQDPEALVKINTHSEAWRQQPWHGTAFAACWLSRPHNSSISP